VQKIIRVLPKTWEVNAITLKELNYIKEIELRFHNELEDHGDEGKKRSWDIKRDWCRTQDLSKRVQEESVTTLTTSEDDEELTLQVKIIKNMYHKSDRRGDPRRKGKKKAIKATTWDLGSEFEDDFAHMCFMVQGDDPLEINSEFDFDEDDKLSYDDLTMCCEELFEK